jgi:dihydrofolate reductase
MTTVVLDISMSLDGYITAACQTVAEPLGKGGLVLHEWRGGDDAVGRELEVAGVARYKAAIAGRGTYDHSLPFWGAWGPTGRARTPTFVVTHEPPARSPEGGVYEFVTGVDEALKCATAGAGDGDVEVIGGADLARQFIQAGLIDEVIVHLVPVLFGDGTRLFEAMNIDHTQLEVMEVVQTRAATHFRYRVLKPESSRAA